MAEVAKIREDYKLFESEMSAKLNELKTLKSQAKMAQLRENINSVNARYTSRSNTVGSVNESMDRARELVNRKTARANAVESLGDTNMDLKLKRLDMNSAKRGQEQGLRRSLAASRLRSKGKSENKVSQ
jgi:phage shock protein A